MDATYKPRVKSTADRALFFGVFLIGVLGAVMLKTIPNSEGVRVWAPLLFNVFLQVFYAYCVMSLRLFRLREDRAGDSFYYLGLLFTLVSLAHTLWSFGRDPDTSQIISGFGIALATTIVGLALRLLAQQFHSDPIEVETEARNAMVEAAVELRSELYSIVTDLGTLRQSVRQVIEEGAAETVGLTTSAISKVVDECSRGIEDATGKMVEGCSALRASAEGLTQSADATATALSKVARRIDKIEVPENFADSVLGPTREQLLKMTTALSQAADGQREQLARLGALVTSAAGALTAVESTASQTKVVADEVFKTIRTFGGELTRISPELANLLRVLTDSQVRQRSLLDQSEVASAALSERIHGALHALGDAHGRAADSVVRSTRVLDEAVSKHSAAIGVHLSRAEVARKRLVDELTQMAETIADKLA